MSEFDQRQYRVMLEMLQWIEEGGDPSNVPGDLMILLDILEASEPAWDSDFGDGVRDIDADVAVAAGEAEKRGVPDLSFDEETATRLRSTAARLKQMVLAKIEAPADDSQDID
jgi:hypothetical protein